MGAGLNGILLVDKAGGETSHDVVQKARKALGVGKAGHTGTLDPLATGLLVILVGQGTKLSPYLSAERKRYLATAVLGVETDTMDADGRVVRRRAVEGLTREAVVRAGRSFVGPIEQVPPAYSAVKVGGVRAYRLARRGSPVLPPARGVTVYSLDFRRMDLPEVTLEMECSSGTYVRSLVSDLGRRLGAGGHLKALRRLAVGPFSVEGAVRSADLEALGESAGERIIPLRAALPGMRECRVPESVASRIRCGRRPGKEELCLERAAGGRAREPVKVVQGDRLVAIVRTGREGEDEHGNVKLERVFE